MPYRLLHSRVVRIVKRAGKMQALEPARAQGVSAMLELLLEDPAHGFSLGVQGALAEFMRGPREALKHCRQGSWCGRVTRRGAIAVDCGQPLRICARECFSSGSGGWRQALALCLDANQARRAARRVVTELGPDHNALISPAGEPRLFDLGLGIAHVDVCISTTDENLIERLRFHQGEALLAPGSSLVAELVRHSPRRVFLTTASRIEVDTPIPLEHSVVGPHTHLLPKRLGRPEPNACCPGPGLLSILNIHPAHPCHDQQGRAIRFEARRHAQFQALLRRYGAADYVAYKQQALELLAAGAEPGRLPVARNRQQRTAARLALRQAVAQNQLPQAVLARWRRRLEPAARQTDSDRSPG